MSENKDIGRT